MKAGIMGDEAFLSNLGLGSRVSPFAVVAETLTTPELVPS